MDIFSNEMIFLFSAPFITVFFIKVIEIIKKSYKENIIWQIFTVGIYALFIDIFSFTITVFLFIILSSLGEFVTDSVYCFFVLNENFVILVWFMCFSSLFSVLYFQKINVTSYYQVRNDGLTDYERKFCKRILNKKTFFYNNLYSEKSENERGYYVKQWVMDRRKESDIYRYSDGDVSVKYGYFHEKMKIHYEINNTKAGK